MLINWRLINMAHTAGISEGEFIAKEGKLIRIRAKFKGDIIEEVRITGDFFMHPEDRIEHLEEELKNVSIASAGKVINEAFSTAEYAGITPEIVERGIREAWLRRR